MNKEQKFRILGLANKIKTMKTNGRYSQAKVKSSIEGHLRRNLKDCDSLDIIFDDENNLVRFEANINQEMDKSKVENGLERLEDIFNENRKIYYKANLMYDIAGDNVPYYLAGTIEYEEGK